MAQLGCATLGQTPSTAFPICATTAFHQNTVPICTNNSIPVPGCENTGVVYEDKNPYWYQFTCYAAGTLEILITPNNLNDDYDWQLFDITGHSANEVYTNSSLFVVGNWSGSSGTTGTSSTASNSIQCASNPAENISTFSKNPTLQQGHTYLLLISHYTDSQSGYSLSLGGSAVIVNPVPPSLNQAAADCEGKNITITLSKDMKCSSLASNGSDFFITPSLASIVSATATACNQSFAMNQLVISLNNALPPGNYTIAARKGSDLNTLLDNCNTAIPEGTSIPLTILPIAPTPMDSLTPVSCAPSTLQLIFSKPIRCNSIEPNGSDFAITGSFPATILSAKGNCTNEESNSIELTLAEPLVHEGTYTITLQTGTDGNTIVDNCGQQTPVNSTLSFNIKDTVSAFFNYSILYGCKQDTIVASHDGRNGVNEWLWNFEENNVPNTQNTQAVYTKFGEKNILLTVSNGFCTDSFSTVAILDNELQAKFQYPSVLCPQDTAYFINESIGNILNWNWSFGDGATSTLQQPTHLYPTLETEKIYRSQLIVENNLHCFDTAIHYIKAVANCYIAVPTGFTPNQDGRNDYLYPLNAYKALQLHFKIFNRWGQLVFETTDWTQKWDGSFQGKPQPADTYVWFLEYVHADTGEHIKQKGTTVLIR